MSKKNAIFWDDKSSNEVLDEAERIISRESFATGSLRSIVVSLIKDEPALQLAFVKKYHNTAVS